MNWMFERLPAANTCIFGGLIMGWMAATTKTDERICWSSCNGDREKR